MDDRTAVSWLGRRAGFGLGPGELDAATALGVDGVLDRLVDPDGHGVAAAPDPWSGLDLAYYKLNDPKAAAQRTPIVLAWLAAMVTTPRPLEEWMRWFWHGHFVSTLRTVKDAPLMVGQLRMLGERGMGDFRSLLRAVTVDPAMLIYLDGDTNRKGGVNENFGREVLELFSLGIGQYTEDDVRAGATALTGWTVDHPHQTAVFVPARHDDSAQHYLDRDGVHDVDSVIDAIVAHPACATFITTKLCRALLGTDLPDGLVDRLAGDFAASGLQIRPLVRSILQAGLDGGSSPLILAPVPWIVAALRTVGIQTTDLARTPLLSLRAAGQVPMDAPNVAGWPGGRSWLGSSTTLARMTMAGLVAMAAPKAGPARQAAVAGDLDALAGALNRPEGFTPATTSALQAVGSGDKAAVSVLTVALASPDLEIA